MAAFLVIAIASGMIGAIVVLGSGGSLLAAFLAYIGMGMLGLLLPALVVLLRRSAQKCPAQKCPLQK